MALSIRTNVAALSAGNQLNKNNEALTKSLARLSSGERISILGDDPAGVGLSSSLKAQLASYGAAATNATFGQSVLQTAEGALNETANLLTRLRELATASASDGSDRDSIQAEADEIIAELDRIDASTEFNSTSIFGASFTFQVGIRATANDTIEADLSAVAVDATSLGVNGVDLETDAATSAGFFDEIDDAITEVNAFRATIGALANRLSSASASIASATESLTAANSKIADVDIAAETAELSRAQILVQAGVSVLAQANIAPQTALKLIDALT